MSSIININSFINRMYEAQEVQKTGAGAPGVSPAMKDPTFAKIMMDQLEDPTQGAGGPHKTDGIELNA
mgnify:CR=1 FL=1